MLPSQLCVRGLGGHVRRVGMFRAGRESSSMIFSRDRRIRVNRCRRMVDQAEIHRNVVSVYAEVRREVASQLRDNFVVLPDRKQAWNDLHNLTDDDDRYVRLNAADVLGYAFPHVLDREQAFNDLHRLTGDRDVDVRLHAADALHTAFPHVTDKIQAWNDLHRLTKDEYSNVQLHAAVALGYAFPHIPDREQAWNDLHSMTEDEDQNVRRGAADALCIAFLHVPDREQAFNDLHRLTGDKDVDVRLHVAVALGHVFPHVPDREQAWNDLHSLTEDEDQNVRSHAALALGYAFPHVTDKIQAWNDLHRLIKDEDQNVRSRAAVALGYAFPHIPDREQAWNDLHSMTEDEDQNVRSRAAHALGHVFPHVPDREQAWNDLRRLTEDEDQYVRSHAAVALGYAFPHVPDREQAWNDLRRLTKDEDRDARVSANHSLGRASIFKATETKSEEKFRKEIKNAIKFFERSSNETFHFTPSKFCLPFYRLFHAIMFEGAGVDEVQKHFAEAESVLKGSESKETLLKVVENLANALAEAQKAGETGFDTMNSDLNAYRRYCDRAVDFIGDAEEKAPGAAEVLKRSLPIIDDRIKELLEEVRTKAEIVCKTTDYPESELGCKIEQHAATARATDNPATEYREINYILRDFEIWSRSISDENEKEYVQEMIFDAKNEDTTKGQLSIIRNLLGRMMTFSVDGGYKMPYVNVTGDGATVQIAKGKEISQEMKQSVNLQKGLSQNNAETDKPPKKEEQTETTTIPHLSYLESEIYDLFKSVYQKEREEGVSEVNSKTLELLKSKLFGLTESGKEINWLDVGCGDGRCLEVLDAIQNRKKIRYHGIDNMHKYLDDAEDRARGYGIIATFDKTNAAVMDFDSKYDVISAVLLLHEVDPLCLPYVLRNMLNALKDDGTLMISDFQGPYEQESDVVVWSAENIEDLLENIGVTWIKTEFIPSKQYPEELGFYRCRVKKPRFANEKFDELLQGYDNFLTAKKKESKQERNKLRVQIEERVQELLNRPDIDLKNLSKEEKQRIRNEIEPEYGIKAYKVRLLVSQIEFLDDKIEEFNNGAGCAGAD